MKRESYIRYVCGAGIRAGGRRFAYVLCAAVLLASAGSLPAAGTGTLDKVSGWYKAGTNLTVTAAPHIYSEFYHWQWDVGGADTNNNIIAFNVDGSREVTAVFRDKLTAAGAVPLYWLAANVPDSTNDFEAAAIDDPDDDGFTTAQEYWSGTDPTNKNSHLKIDSVVLTGGNLELKWQHSHVVPDMAPISIESRTNLVYGVWETFDTKAPEVGTNTWQGLMSLDRFYRLSVTNMP